MEKIKQTTADTVEKNIGKITKLFPNVITETKDADGNIVKAIDFEKLKQELSKEIVNGEESYDFTWVGKNQAVIEANTPTNKTLRPCKAESVNWDKTENVYIEGDNLEVLKLLQETYLNKIKMIYIDPPYNTGNDFIYKDSFEIDKEEYEQELKLRDEEGNKQFKENNDSNPRFHSDWCSMIYSRLKIARNLLTDDGVIFISIDDNEVDNLKKICNEIFGEKNFYGTLIQLKGNTQNDSKSIQKNHEYILVYTKNNQPLLLTYNNDVMHEVFENKFYLGRDTGASSGHDKLLERVNLGYTIYYFEGTQSGATGNHNTLLERVNLGYSRYPGFNYFISKEKIIHAIALMDYDQKKITGDSTEEDVYNDEKYLLDLGYKKIRPPKRKGGKLGCWTWGLDTFKELWNKNEVLIKNDKNVIKKEFINEKDIVEIKGKKYFFKTNNLPLQSIIKITNSEGTKILKGNNGLMPGIDFNNPKNPELIHFFLKSYNDKRLIVLDFFSGSATTAHAVMQLNSEDGGNRKFIMVQLPEQCDEKSEAYKAGYKNICEIGKERIRRAGKKIVEETGKTDLDIGFRVFKLDESNMKEVHFSPKDFNQDFLTQLEDNIKEDRNSEDLLFACMLNWGLELSLPHRIEKIDNNEIHIVNENELIACFDKNISENVVKKIAEKQPLRVVFRDNSFGKDSDRINVEEIFKLKSPNTKIKVL